MGILPEFIIAGFQKCGTTSLHENLRKHPSIFMPEKCTTSKEIAFFNSLYHKGIDYYKNLFIGGEKKICGQKCPDYVCDEETIKRIYKHIPTCKILLCIRNPTNRLFSQINMRRKLGKNIDVKKALEDPEYYKRGRYMQTTRVLLKYFPKDQIHFVRLPEFAINRKKLFKNTEISAYCSCDCKEENKNPIKSVFDFLGAENCEINSYEYHFVSYPYLQEYEKHRVLVNEFYKKDNQDFFDFLGFKIEGWYA